MGKKNIVGEVLQREEAPYVIDAPDPDSGMRVRKASWRKGQLSANAKDERIGFR